MSKSGRNNAIEFLRFLFAVIIILFHGVGAFPISEIFPHIRLFFHGDIGVEYFFLVSGYLMAKSADKPREPGMSIGRDTATFIGKKYGGIFPYHLYAFFVAFAVTAVVQRLSAGGAVKLLAHSLPNLFLLDMTGIRYTIVNGYEWYISAMLLAMLFIYPLLRRFYSYVSYAAAPLAALLILGYMSYSYGSLTWVTFWTGFLYKGVVRAVAIILLGVVSYVVSKKLRQLSFTRLGLFGITVLEIFGYFATICYICTDFSEDYYFYLVFFLMLSVAITFSGKTITTKLLKGKFFGFLGKLSLPLYLNQYYSLMLVNTYLTAYSPTIRLIVFFLLSFVSAILCMVVVDMLKKHLSFKKLFLKPQEQQLKQ